MGEDCNSALVYCETTSATKVSFICSIFSFFFISCLHRTTKMRLSVSIPTALVLLVAVASAQNQCYYAADERAGSAIIPCGGSSSISACCQIGDLCLSDSACWNPTHNVTYLYGCTDPTYTDSACPWKCGSGFGKTTHIRHPHIY